MAKKLYKQKSDYTLLKTKHQQTPDGVIYENDYMTIMPIDDVFNDQITVFSDSNFKFSVNTAPSTKAYHKSSGWIGPNGSTGDTSWTLETIETSSTSEIKIVPKSNYNSLQDFAYYGPAAEMLKASIGEIIEKFPAGLYFNAQVDDEIKINKNAVNYSKFGSTKGYVVLNPFEIDILTVYIDQNDVKNILRYLNISYDDYETSDGDNVVITSPEIYNLKCPKENYSKDGVFLGSVGINGLRLFIYYQGGKTSYITGRRATFDYIRPKREVIHREYSKLTEFERILLDDSTNPIYTSYFDTPYETNEGVRYEKRSYTWPSVGNYNPLLSGPEFDTYVSSLADLANFYDEHFSNNIWRNMTHESIKNLDWTFFRYEDGEAVDLSDINSSKIEAMLKIWGRNSDDIKRNISSIKDTSNVSYDQKNNIPDYFLSDEVEISGFDGKVLGLGDNNSVRTDNLSYSGLIDGFTPSDANSEIFRRIKINSKYLSSIKGTKEGLCAMLALLGIDDGSYVIKEYIGIAHTFPDFEKVSEINMARKTKLGFDLTDELDGLPVIPVTNGEITYVVPWYNINERYDNGIYFQMFGGWFKIPEKKVNYNGEDVVIRSKGAGSFNIYDETVQRLKIANTMEDMYMLPISSLYDGDICFVTDEERYFKYTLTEEAYTWTEIEESDETIYLKTIVESTVGNNPHNGYGDYDDGREYINRLNGIFSYFCDDFSYLGNEYWENSAKTQTFSIESGVTDNQKTWYFIDENIDNDNNFVGEQLLNDFSGDSYIRNGDYGIEGKLVNNEGGEDYEEAASFSVVNLKNMSIDFDLDSVPEGMWEEYKDYIMNVVLFYVKQMVPSTTIISCKIYSFSRQKSNDISIEIGCGSENEINIEIGCKAENEINIEIGCKNTN